MTLVTETVETGSSNNGSLDLNSVTISDELKESYLKVINDIRAEGRECGKYGYFEPAPALEWNDKLLKLHICIVGIWLTQIVSLT